VLEYGAHARAISKFIVRTYADESAAVEWEQDLWGDKAEAERPLVLLRSLLTILSAAVPTLAIMAFAGVMFDRAAHPGLVALIASVAGFYVLAVIASGWALFRRAA
jgi:uncharacterized membrane protein YqjE